MINKISVPFLLFAFVLVAVALFSRPAKASATWLDGYVAEHRDWEHRIWHHDQVTSERL